MNYRPGRIGYEMKTRIIACAFALLMSVQVSADISQPDAIVYGTLRIDGEVVGASGAYTVIARVGGADAPVAVYRMGDHPAAGHRYVLHFPHAVQTDGKTPSTDSPQEGALAEVYVMDNTDGNEVLAGSIKVPASGKAQQLDLLVAGKDLDAGYALNNSSANGCSAEGGTCGAVGAICPLLMLCGLVRMRLRYRP
ncbi:MAG: hypothetical protein JSU63_06840 [Phycisphaerales bacterium]|nr:MAG: hypothetical protein JSU63_06840 [Phycisphaerales bacterium]